MSNCPNHCKNGMYIDPYTHKRRICEYCRDKRKEEIASGSESVKLRLPPSLCGSNFSVDNVIPQSALRLLEEDSVNEVKAVMEKLISDIVLCQLPEESMLFNFGSRCHDANFIAPFMRKAYEAGLSVAPLLTPTDIVQLRRAYNDGKEVEFSYDDVIHSQVCVIVLDAGTLNEEILYAKGVMQLRAYQKLPTIFVTHIWNSNLNNLCGDTGGKSYDLATCYTVRYTKSEESVQDGQRRMTLDSFVKKFN